MTPEQRRDRLNELLAEHHPEPISRAALFNIVLYEGWTRSHLDSTIEVLTDRGDIVRGEMGYELTDKERTE